MRTLGSVFKRGKVYYIIFTHRGRRYKESSGQTQRKVAIALLLATALDAAGVLLAVRRPPADAAMAARYAGVLLAVAVALAPAGRLGYLIYPVNLLVWSWVLASGAYPVARQPRHAPGADPSRNGGGSRAGADRAVSNPTWPGRHRRGSAAGDDGHREP